MSVIPTITREQLEAGRIFNATLDGIRNLKTLEECAIAASILSDVSYWLQFGKSEKVKNLTDGACYHLNLASLKLSECEVCDDE